MSMESNSHLMGATSVMIKNTIKCSSMKSGVFAFALNFPQWGSEAVFPTLDPNCGPVHE